jgi:copper homeostasis protein
MIKEACVESLGEALMAQKLGANRIELCDSLSIGGTTPTPETLLSCKKHLKIPVMAMIRPRGGNFVYTKTEVERMLHDIKTLKKAGADGFVTGALTPTGEIDLEILKLLVSEAKTCEITFHKAIDETRDIPKEFSRLQKSGVHRLLSSGGAATAMEGAEMLNRLIQMTDGRVILIAAGKITFRNLSELSRLIHTSEFHGRKIVGELTG